MMAGMNIEKTPALFHNVLFTGNSAVNYGI